ncbi:phosphatase PAP2 family protein [Bdellovibrio sp. HCB337]|uniref:phosphatase PAP2 family protein n=1 Tax=Bdellovibrio sp. HCB337 TaxID=3394358 RepID=UPI0039A633A6
MSLQLTLVFCTTYGFTNWRASQHSDTYRFWMDWELGIPLVPATIIIYVSLNILTLLPLFTLNSSQIKALGKSLLVATVIAAVIFFFFPAHIGWARTSDVGFWTPFYETLFSLDQTANTLPSLHITYSYLVVRAIASVHLRLKQALWFWFACISMSVLLTHQHHVLDIVGGMVLAEACFRVLFAKKITN